MEVNLEKRPQKHRVIVIDMLLNSIEYEIAEEGKAEDKTFEVRYNDRGYQKGDYVVFKPMDGFVYHPHQIEYKKYVITYVHSGLGLEKDFIVFGIKEAEE